MIGIEESPCVVTYLWYIGSHECENLPLPQLLTVYCLNQIIKSHRNATAEIAKTVQIVRQNFLLLKKFCQIFQASRLRINAPLLQTKLALLSTNIAVSVTSHIFLHVTGKFEINNDDKILKTKNIRNIFSSMY